MFEASVPAVPLVPMAIALSYGVLYASVMTLFLVPVGYLIVDDIRAAIAQGGSGSTSNTSISPGV